MNRKKPEGLTPGGLHEILDDPLFDQGHVLQQVPTRPKPEGGSMPAKDTYLDGDSTALGLEPPTVPLGVSSDACDDPYTIDSSVYGTDSMEFDVLNINIGGVSSQDLDGEPLASDDDMDNASLMESLHRQLGVNGDFSETVSVRSEPEVVQPEAQSGIESQAEGTPGALSRVSNLYKEFALPVIEAIKSNDSGRLEALLAKGEKLGLAVLRKHASR